MIRFRLIEGYYGARVGALYILCSAEKLFIVRLSLKEEKKSQKETPRIFFTLPPFFSFLFNSFFCLKFPIRSFPVSKTFFFSLFLVLVFSLYFSTLNWTGIMLMSVEYYTTHPNALFRVSRKRHGSRWKIPGGCARERKNTSRWPQVRYENPHQNTKVKRKEERKKK